MNRPNPSDLRICIEALQRLLADPSGTFGLCDRLDEALAARLRPRLKSRDLAPYFRRWPEFSGSIIYPVPCSETELTNLLRLNGDPPIYHYDLHTPEGRAEAAFMQTLHFKAGAQQRYRGEYGAARLRLAAFLLQAFEAELANYEEPPCPTSPDR